MMLHHGKIVKTSIGIGAIMCWMWWNEFHLMDCMHTYKLFINVRCDAMTTVCTKNLAHTQTFARIPTSQSHIHFCPTTLQMEKGALAHTSNMLNLNQYDTVSPTHTSNTRDERDICHCEIFGYSHIAMLHLSIWVCVCILGHSNGNSIQYSRRSKYFNYKHVSFYLFRFFFLLILFCWSILFAWAHQWFFIGVICSLIFIWNVALFSAQAIRFVCTATSRFFFWL